MTRWRPVVARVLLLASAVITLACTDILVRGQRGCETALLTPIRLDDYGVGQALDYFDGKLYISMSGAGRIVEFDPATLTVTWTGLLQQNGRSLVDHHPTGIAYKPRFPTLVGAKNRFVEINWARFRTDGNLDLAYVREIADPYADLYVRAQYVEFDGKTYLVTADYRAPGKDSRLRYYDVAKLADPAILTTEHALAFTEEAPPWIQAISAADGRLVLARNRSRYHGWMIDYVGVKQGTIRSFCINQASELEAFYEIAGRQFFLTGDEALPNLYVREVRP